MLAAVCEKPHEIRLREVDAPTPGPGEVLCRVRACGFCGSDLHIIEGAFPGVQYPLIPGHEWSGEVAEAGEGVEVFHPGDRIAIEPHASCGRCENCLRGQYTICLNYGRWPHRHIGYTADGGFAEFCVVPVQCLHLIPDDMGFAEATLVTTAGTAIMGLERARVETGDRVLVLGAGPVGMLTAQFARFLGAGEVIITDVDEARLAMARDCGIDRPVHAERDDLASAVGPGGVDLAAVCAGVPALVNEALGNLRRGGRLLLLGLSGGRGAEIDTDLVVLENLTVFGSRAEGDRACSRAIRAYASGRLSSAALVTHRFPLGEFCAAYNVFHNRRDGAMKVVVEV
jgi:2-desacetyl-2-hydroxyethyl bacteriochlorophyllide A dehydrogenase